MRATTRWACVLLLGGLLVGGCARAVDPDDGPVAAPSPVDETDGPTGTSPTASPGPAVPDPPAPTPPVSDDHPLAFTARQLGGGSIDAAELAGGHVVLWLWTPW